jgi:hypothetical protein
LARVLPQTELAAFRALDTPCRCSVGERRATGRTGGIPRQVGHAHVHRFDVGRDLDETNRALRQCEHERDLRECHRAEEGLDVKPVGHRDRAEQAVWQPEGGEALGRGEDRQASGQVAPKPLVLDQVADLLLDRHALPLGNTRSA